MLGWKGEKPKAESHWSKAAVQSIPDGMHMYIYMYGRVRLWLPKYWQVNQPLHKRKVVSTPVPATKPSNVFYQLQGLDGFLYM